MIKLGEGLYTVVNEKGFCTLASLARAVSKKVMEGMIEVMSMDMFLEGMV